MRMRSFLFYLVGFLSLFYNYIGQLSFVVYPYIFIKTRFVLPVFDWAVLLYLIISFFFAVYFVGFIEAAQVYRFYWGFLAFYLFFKANRSEYNIKYVVFILLLLTFIESMLVNTLVSAQGLPNYPDIENPRGHFSDIWQRVYGFGGNSSVLSVLLVALSSIIPASTILASSLFIVILIIGSGSGVVSYIGYILCTLKFKKLFILMIVALIMGIMFHDAYFLNSVAGKASFKYINYLFELKYSQIINLMSDMEYYELLFGTPAVSNMGGDFLWLSFFHNYGVIGLIVMFVFMLRRINSINRLGILIIFVMTSHYFVLFALPGQLIAGYMFSLKPDMKFFKYTQHKI